MNKLLLIFGAFLVFGVFIFLFQRSEKERATIITPSSSVTQLPTETVDYTAGFAIYTHGTFRVFTASMYHYLSPEVYIQADNPNIVRIKKSGITWGNFFDTLPFKVTPDCLTTGTGQRFCTGQKDKLFFYLNGVKNDDLLNSPIRPADKVLITFGDSTDAVIQSQLQSIPQINDQY